MIRIITFYALICLLFSCGDHEQYTLFVGSFTDNKPSNGLSAYSYDVKEEKLSHLFDVDEIINPSFLAISRNSEILYTITESRLNKPGFVSAYSILPDTLLFINKVTTGGRNPVHIALSDDGQFIAISNYTDASIAIYRLSMDGSISSDFTIFHFEDSSIVQGRQDAAHIHSANFSKDGRFLFAHDLGGDKIRTIELSEQITVREDLIVDIAPGSGPRHFVFDDENEYGYLMNELGGRVDVFAYNSEDGILALTSSTLTYADSLEIYRSADIHITPNNRFLLLSNRGPAENTIVVFKRLLDGTLELVQRKKSGGSFPRNFAISPDGEYIAVVNKESGTVNLFPFNQHTGFIGQEIGQLKKKQVSCVVFKHESHL